MKIRMIETKNEDRLEKFRDFIGKFSKHVMIASILTLIIGAVISLFLSILKFSMISLIIFSSAFSLFIGLISAEALLYKVMEEEVKINMDDASQSGKLDESIENENKFK